MKLQIKVAHWVLAGQDLQTNKKLLYTYLLRY